MHGIQLLSASACIIVKRQNRLHSTAAAAACRSPLWADVHQCGWIEASNGCSRIFVFLVICCTICRLGCFIDVQGNLLHYLL
jgi:hypothetical protein